MKLTTCKGAFSGTITECAAWLEKMQPAYASVEVEMQGETAEASVETPDGMESGWENTQELRAALREARDEAYAECESRLV
jgi:hypothetical protein